MTFQNWQYLGTSQNRIVDKEYGSEAVVYTTETISVSYHYKDNGKLRIGLSNHYFNESIGQSPYN